MKYKTVREGEQAVIYNHLGEGRLIVGPERVFLFRERLTNLRLVTASQYEYLVIKDNNGFMSHKPGPCSMFENPLEYKSVERRDATKIDANHVLVVYRKMKDNHVERRIVNGPTVFMPEAEEWCHDFKWHGEDPQQKGRMIPGSRKFTQLAAVPDQFYYNVREVRTTDDTLLTVKLMIFYELNDIIEMLNNTHDPIADMINGVCADVISFAGKLTFQEFLNKTKQLSVLETFPQLLQRAKRVGYQVNKVVYRGYHASDQLQAMQDTAIASRARMRLDAELQDQNQRVKDFKLHREQARTKLKQDMERSKVDHRQTLENIKQEHELNMKNSEHQVNLLLSNVSSEVDLEISQKLHEAESAHLEKLSSVEVDLTEFLVNQHQMAPTEVLQVVNPSAGGRGRTAPGGKDSGGGGGTASSAAAAKTSPTVKTSTVTTL